MDNSKQYVKGFILKVVLTSKGRFLFSDIVHMKLGFIALQKMQS